MTTAEHMTRLGLTHESYCTPCGVRACRHPETHTVAYRERYLAELEGSLRMERQLMSRVTDDLDGVTGFALRE